MPRAPPVRRRHTGWQPRSAGMPPDREWGRPALHPPDSATGPLRARRRRTTWPLARRTRHTSSAAPAPEWLGASDARRRSGSYTPGCRPGPGRTTSGGNDVDGGAGGPWAVDRAVRAKYAIWRTWRLSWPHNVTEKV